MKRFLPHVILCTLVVFALGCTSMQNTTPAQTALDTTVIACRGIAASIKSTSAAVKADKLKGANADKAIDGLTKAAAGCDVAVTSLQAAALAASGASK